MAPRRTAWRWRSRRGIAAATAAIVSSLCGSVAAFPGGIATPNCSGCHAGGSFSGSVSLTPDGPLEPGVETPFTLVVEGDGFAAAGFYVSAAGVGQLRAISSGTRVSGGELLHSRPASASAGKVEIQFGWTPPGEPGGVVISATIVAANLNGESNGDVAVSGAVSHSFGCGDGITLYRDLDGDGYGTDRDWLADCAPRDGWSESPDDCNDTWASIFPGAAEVANGRDDDCDGEIDDGIEFADLYPDEDGDGFGYYLGTSVYGEIGRPGYVANAEDCDDYAPEIHPGAEEVCDGRDNDCNDAVDDEVWEYCGVGRCGRVLQICNTECLPGEPTTEMCNGLDDDCDGSVDEGDLCPEGQVCALRCTTPEEAAELGAVVLPEGAGGAAGGAGEGGSSSGSTSQGAAAGVASQGGTAEADAADRIMTPDASVPTGQGGSSTSGRRASPAAMVGGEAPASTSDDSGPSETTAGCALRAGARAGWGFALALALVGLGLRRRSLGSAGS